MTTFPSDSWSPFTTNRDTTTFLQLVSDELRVRNLDFTGAPPVLQSPSGQTLLLDNIALRCSSERRTRWPSLVGDFLDRIGRVANLDDPVALSPDVARASLRLRLAEADVPRLRAGTSALPGSPRDDIAEMSALVLRRDAMPGTVWLLYMHIVGAAFGVLSDHLAGWGIDEDEAFELALSSTRNLPMPRLRWIGGVRSVSDASMFNHTKVLDPNAFLPNSPEGWFVTVPCREEVLAIRAVGTSAGLQSMVELVGLTQSRMKRSGYPLFGTPWFVPPKGMGSYGECAELIGFGFDSVCGQVNRVRMGPLVHELFEEMDDRF